MEYEDFEYLKKERIKLITEENAEVALKTAKKDVLSQLKDLDVHDLDKVEIFYLSVVEMAHAAGLVVAQKIVDRKNIPFAEATISVDSDAVLDTLLSILPEDAERKNFNKILEIDDKYQPGKESWAGAHGRMQIIAHVFRLEKETSILKSQIKEYKTQLREELKEKGVHFEESEEMQLDAPTEKLMLRYKAMETLQSMLENKSCFSQKEVDLIQQEIKECIDMLKTTAQKPSKKELSMLSTLITMILKISLIQKIIKGIGRRFEKIFQKETAQQSSEESSDSVNMKRS